MDESAPLTVAKGTIITSATSATLAGLYGAIKGQGQHAGVLASSAALNGGITAATFFTIREYAVSPLLVSYLPGRQHSHRRRDLGLYSGTDEDGTSAQFETRLTWSELRLHKIPDTGISGALTGGVLNAWKRGRSGIVPGLTTGGLICALLQLVYNEVGVTRVKYISRKAQDLAQSASPLSSAAPPSSSRHLKTPSEPSKPMFERILDMFGLHRVSDDEYLAKMKKTREGYLERIRDLEREIEEGKKD